MLFKMRLFARAPPANNQRKIFLYHLKAYLYGFILSRDKYQKKYHVFSGFKSKSRNQQNSGSSAHFCLRAWGAKHNFGTS